jgi:hypothetical protein
MLEARHSHTDLPEDGYYVTHWGYSDEPLPCTQDHGTCRYLHGVYAQHDISMKYSFILWGVLLGIALAWVTLRGWRMGGPALRVGGIIDKICDSANHAKRRWLLKDAPLTYFFGHTTRLQVSILVIITGYLVVFT